jgi:Spy/CpxP family protein refolding chaperone
MKTKYFIPKMMATIALLALTIPLPAFSQMMEMGHMDKMEDMMGMCIQHAEKLELTDAQLQKMKPAHSEMQKKQPVIRPI